MNTGSRRLLTYSRIPDAEVSASALEEYNGRQKLVQDGTTADELNPFRESYFKGFKTDQ
jgi:tRNA (guanine10-N2)-methyltransferase